MRFLREISAAAALASVFSGFGAGAGEITAYTALEEDDVRVYLEAFAKARGINLIVDGSQVPMVYAADALDITTAFIAEFNSKNPATASVAPRP